MNARKATLTSYPAVWLWLLVGGMTLVGLGCSTVPHGEGELGPHGGYIKMPGEFHVEVVPKTNQSFDVYLLDLQNREPLTLASQLTAEIEQKNVERRFSCETAGDHYHCNLPEGFNLSEGELTIQAVRRERTGREATYSLPLRLPG